MSLQNRIDFAGIIVVDGANPNGDPTAGNAPRTTLEGNGEISDVCLKRKIRDRLQTHGASIFVQRDDRNTDGIWSLQDRASLFLEKHPIETETGFISDASKEWLDVRAFGQIFPWVTKAGKRSSKKDGEASNKRSGAVSIGIRGPVSIGRATSIDIVIPNVAYITSATNRAHTDIGVKGRDTFGAKKVVINKSAYVFYGGISCQLAQATGFDDKDADAIKQAILTMFQDDSSAARPAGSMSLDKLYWWRHSCASGQYSPAKVHHSLHISPSESYPYYTATLDPLDGLTPEILSGW